MTAIGLVKELRRLKMKTPEQMAEEYINHVLESQCDCSYRIAFLAGYQAAKPQWISVKDRLPDFDVWCVWGSFDQRCENGIGRREVGDPLDWWSGYDYWWELPEPPKEEA